MSSGTGHLKLRCSLFSYDITSVKIFENFYNELKVAVAPAVQHVVTQPQIVHHQQVN